MEIIHLCCSCSLFNKQSCISLSHVPRQTVYFPSFQRFNGAFSSVYVFFLNNKRNSITNRCLTAACFSLGSLRTPEIKKKNNYLGFQVPPLLPFCPQKIAFETYPELFRLYNGRGNGMRNFTEPLSCQGCLNPFFARVSHLSSIRGCWTCPFPAEETEKLLAKKMFVYTPLCWRGLLGHCATRLLCPEMANWRAGPSRAIAQFVQLSNLWITSVNSTDLLHSWPVFRE